MIAKTLETGSLEIGVYENGLVRLRLTSLRKGEPVSIVSLDNLKEIVAFAEAPIEDDDDEELEDVL
jgi:hypothetical protein